jgi:amino acid transporter
MVMARGSRLGRVVFGAPKDPQAPGAFHKIALIAVLAWVGLGADGLSSSAYGPEEAFKALGDHAGLAVFLALATAITVLVISASYSRVIEQFPAGGGGYSVASKLLGAPVGVVAGSALLVDYVLTITISLAAGADALCSFLPPPWNEWKVPFALVGLGILVILNLRGVKESVTTIAPVFALFLVTHAIVFVAMIVQHVGDFRHVASEVGTSLSSTVSSLGIFGTLHVLARAYALGGGTYTGIEATSNGVAMMREPRVQTAKRTMTMMAFSLAITASAILVGYLLVDVRPEPGKTMNAVLFERVAGAWSLSGFEFGHAFVVVALASEAALLCIAAQAGFLDGPRVMANMAADSWLPHRFSALSDRLTMRNGIVIMAVAAFAAGAFTGADVSKLVVMYAINVFVTFSLSNVGMVRFWIARRARMPEWRRALPIHLIAAALCTTILVVTIVEKFGEGAWITILVTLGLVGLCFIVKRHYALVLRALRRLDRELPGPEGAPGVPAVVTTALPAPAAIDPSKPVAILFVGGYGGLGRHALLTCLRMFPGHFQGVVFVSIAVVDSGAFKGGDQVEGLVERTQAGLDAYVRFANSLGLPATSAHAVGTEVPEEAVNIATGLFKTYPRGTFVAGQLIFARDTLWTHVLHNETAFLIQRRLQYQGIQMIVVPVRLETRAGRQPKTEGV